MDRDTTIRPDSYKAHRSGKGKRPTKRPSISCPSCGWHRLIDAGKYTRTKTITARQPDFEDADFYQKCPGCKEEIGLKKE